ncbi:PTS lactose transporter subunit IIBC [Clostridium sp. DMHC 10]|uniref:PTS fructose transporter subunit IIC n=1 Tax=Clostridium sp. DMHC 10 TaxID=747377 RepID=UPI00069D66F8|nr:PTS fructose transporter subunit IIC [Clostridium sp. DMHC 10]KOF58276.1 PTS lactose transporter subunit IIBC [Clostridium sp. DMHC 10]
MKKIKIGRHLMTGVSYMIPIVTAGGLILSIATIFGGQNIWTEKNTFLSFIRDLGQAGLGLIVPVIAAYIAFSIADKPGLAPGFIVGTMANKMGTGFLGGIVVGLMVGFLVEQLKKIKTPDSIMPLMSLVIIPVISTLICGIILQYVVGTPIVSLMNTLTVWLKGMSGGNQVLLAVIIGGMMAFDMGGPINKVAYTLAVALYSQKLYGASSAAYLAISIPPLGLALAAFLAPKKYSEGEKEAAKTALITGIGGITEGALPFALADPLRVIPACMIGTALTTGFAAALGVESKVLLQTVLVIPFVNKPLLHIIAIVLGVVTTAVIANLLKKEVPLEQ